MNNNLKTAVDNLSSALIRHGYRKEAATLQGIGNPQTQTPPQQYGGKLQDDRPEQGQQPQPAQGQQSLYRGQPGSTAPVLELSRILDDIENTPYFRNLPENVLQGILKIKKMTGNAFRYASEKEALFGKAQDPIKSLQDYLTEFRGTHAGKIPEDIKKAMGDLGVLVNQYVQNLPKEKSFLEKARDVAEKGKSVLKGVAEKGQDIARGVAEKSKDVARGVAEKGQEFARGVAEKSKNVAEKGQDFARGVAEKGKDVIRDVAEKGRQYREDQEGKRQEKEDVKTYSKMKRFEDQQLIKDRENSAVSNLKSDLLKSKNYKGIFYRLPTQIIKALEDIGLGIDDLSNMGTAKLAGHVNNTLLNYFRTKEAYSAKELNQGIKEEKEHTEVYNTFVKAIKDKKKAAPLTIREFAEQIAKAHLKEDPQYYTKLKKTFKEAMDFTGIGNLLTPDNTLDERELARVIRLAISAEHDAVHLYELIADASDDEDVKKVMQSIADEEKVHTGELQGLLKKFDKDSQKFLEEGSNEVEDIINK